MRRGFGSPPPAIGMIHDFLMLNALADTPVARGELAQANAALKTASEWCLSNRGSSDFRKPQMDRTTSIATFVAQSTRGDSACAVPQHTARQTSIRGLRRQRSASHVVSPHRKIGPRGVADPGHDNGCSQGRDRRDGNDGLAIAQESEKGYWEVGLFKKDRVVGLQTIRRRDSVCQ